MHSEYIYSIVLRNVVFHRGGLMGWFKILVNIVMFKYNQHIQIKTFQWYFPGGTVVKNPLANAEDTGSIPGLGRSHMLWSN